MKRSLHILGWALALVFITDAAPPTNVNRTAPKMEQDKGVYSSVAESPSARNFDEALWRAISNIADIEARLPGNLETIELEVRSAYYVVTPLRMVFTREALQTLIAGKVSPDRFLREYVQFI